MNVHEFLNEKEYSYLKRSNMAINTILNATDASRKIFCGNAFKKYSDMNGRYISIVNAIKEIKNDYLPTQTELLKISIDKKMSALKKDLFILKTTYKNYRSICNFSFAIQDFYIKKYKKITYTLQTIGEIKKEIEEIERLEKEELREKIYNDINSAELPF